jgi:hypothetical protein
MSNSFIQLDVPARDIAGAPAVTTLAGSPKTFAFAADDVPHDRYVVEGSNDGGLTWDILVGLDGTQVLFTSSNTAPKTVHAIVDRVRVRSAGNGAVALPPSITMASPPATSPSVFGVLNVPQAEGLGIPFDLGASAGPVKTFVVRGDIRPGSRFTILASVDGIHFEPAGVFTSDQQGALAVSVLCRFLRVQRHGLGATPAIAFGSEGTFDPAAAATAELSISEEAEHETSSLSAEEVLAEYAVPLSALSAPVLALAFAAISEQGESGGTAIFRVRLGGAFGVAAGIEIAKAIDTVVGRTSVLVNSAPFARPDQPVVAVKVTGQGDGSQPAALRGFVLLFHSTDQPINQGDEIMSRDVAQRDLDMAGFHLLNLGPPQTAQDATHVDPTTVPLPPSGTGSPGTSFLAAAADHVHPAQPGTGSAAQVTTLTDESLQSNSGTGEEIMREWFVDFDGIDAQQIVPELSLFGKGSGTFNLRAGGTPGAADGTVIASTIVADAGTFHPVNNRGEAFAKLTGVQPVKVTVTAPNAGIPVSARGKVVTLKGA